MMYGFGSDVRKRLLGLVSSKSYSDTSLHGPYAVTRNCLSEAANNILNSFLLISGNSETVNIKFRVCDINMGK